MTEQHPGWDRIAIFERLHARLIEEQSLRPQRRGTRSSCVDSLGRDIVTLEWIAAEHNAMRNLVNDIRAERGLPVVDSRLIAIAEQQAAGHFDYTKKYALYCADVALDLQTRP